MDRVCGIDQQRQEIHFENRTPIPFDALSIGVGSVPTTNNIQDPDGALLLIKPMQTFLQRLEDRVAQLNSADAKKARPLRVAIVGAGVAGIEIVFCIQQYFERRHLACEVRLVTRGEQILSGMQENTRHKVHHELAKRNIQVNTSQQVTEVTYQYLRSQGTSTQDARGDSREWPADIVIAATGARAPEFLGTLSLPKDPRGFLATDATLRSTKGSPVFAVGDTGTIVQPEQNSELPKAGVYAVRQGPFLWKNLRRLLDGKQLANYSPQQDFLRLINLGDGQAIGQLRGLAFQGHWVYRLKNRIDSKFMEKFEPVVMQAERGEEMQCQGCGCKFGADNLQSAIQTFLGDEQQIELEDVSVVGEEHSRLVASTDFFTLPINDAFLSGRITAIHAASDVIAAGGKVQQALANVVLQEGDPRSQQRYLHDFLTGANQEFEQLGGTIVGGHTIVGPRVEAGFTVIGSVGDTRFRKSELQVGDKMYLTKPIGVGVALAAHMRALLPADAFRDLLNTMLQSNHEIANCAAKFGVKAATDITGFGLAGHLIEMLQASQLSATLFMDQVDFLACTQKLVQEGIESSLLPDNIRTSRFVEKSEDFQDKAEFRLMFDPQTCGGLLLAIPSREEEAWLLHLAQLSRGKLAYIPKCIGVVEPMRKGNGLIKIQSADASK